MTSRNPFKYDPTGAIVGYTDEFDLQQADSQILPP
jgi:hypothetical protein